MQKNVLTIISVVVVVFLIGLIVWNIIQGNSVKEVMMPNGASVKFENKKEQSLSSIPPVESVIKTEDAPIKQKRKRANNPGEAKTSIQNLERSIEQHTEGKQSPAVNTGRDSIINYGNN